MAELGEFLHTENQMLNETLAELDKDLKSLNLKLKAKSSELCKSEEQVRHLVRINEQRHQQILYVKSGMKTLESKAKDIIFKQVGSCKIQSYQILSSKMVVNVFEKAKSVPN